MALMPAMNGVVPYTLRMYGPIRQRSVAVATAVSGTRALLQASTQYRESIPARSALREIVSISWVLIPPPGKISPTSISNPHSTRRE